MIEFLVDNVCVRFGRLLFRQTVGILIRTNVPHCWLACFSIPMRICFRIGSEKKAKESLLDSSTFRAIILMIFDNEMQGIRLQYLPRELTISRPTESTSSVFFILTCFL